MNILSAPEPYLGDPVRRAEDSQPDVSALVRLGARISRSLDPNDVRKSSLEGIQAIVGGDLGGFLLIQPDAPTLRIENAVGISPSLLERLRRIALAPAALARASDPENASQVILTVGQQIRDALKAESITAFVLIPLTALGRAIGVLLVGMGERKPLTPLGVDLLMSIGEQVGMAIENARLHTSLRESEAWHRTFIESSPDAFIEFDAVGTITFANAATCRVFECGRDTLLGTRLENYLLDSEEEQRDSRQELYSKGYLLDQLAKIRTVTGKTKMVSYAARLVRDSQGEIVRYQAVFRDVTTEQQMLEALRRRNEELAALNAIARILSHPLDVAGALDEVCTQIAAITGMETSVIYLVDETQPFAHLVAYWGLSDELVEEMRRLGMDDPMTRHILGGDGVVQFDDLASYEGSGFAGPRAAGYRALVSAPIRRSGKQIGAIGVGSKTARCFEQSDVDLLVNVANQIGVALENVDLYAQMQRRITELDGLAQLSAACTASLEPQTICNLAVEWAQKLLHVPACNLRLIEKGQLHLEAVRGQRPEVGVSERLEISAVARAIIEQRIPHVINDLESDTSLAPWAKRLALAHGIRASVAVPLLARDQAIGILRIGDAKPRQWSQPEIGLLQTIANQVASALDNARLFQEVVREQRKVRAIFDSGLSGLYAADADGRIVMFNRAAEQITGWTSREVLGKTWGEVFADPAARPAVEPLIRAALIRKRAAYVPEGRTIRTRHGRIIPTAQAVAPLLDEQGNVTGVVGAFWDLTREQAAEQAREHFLTMVAHQLRSPLAAFLVALQLLERRNLAPARRVELWAIMKREGERLQKFADQLLEYESAVRAPRALRRERLDIARVVRQVVSTLRATRCGHRFRVRIGKPSPLAYADPDGVEHVLRNLLDNAVKYSPAGGLVTVSVKTLESGMVEITVQDEGPGIPVEDREWLFEPLYRSVASPSRRVHGHGFGLPIARQMVERMGGAIWIDSQDAGGTIVHFTLPRSP